MTFQPGFNPFQSQEIFINRAYHEQIKELSIKGSGEGEHEGVSGQPFRRMVDAWLLAVALGAVSGLPAPDVSESTMVKVITGAVFQKDLDAICFLMSVAVSATNDPYVVEDPRKMIRIASGFAELGFPQLLELTRAGQLGITENLARGLVKSLAAK
jgi:hypothetical protein